MITLYWQDAQGLSPPTMMLGCHETRAELGLGTGQRGFAGGIFDEVISLTMRFFWGKYLSLFLSLISYFFGRIPIFSQVAFWDRRIGDDEIHMFLGGYSKIQNPIELFKIIKAL